MQNVLKSINLNENTELCYLMEKYSSDKSTWHNYTPIYHTLFSPLQKEPINLFEMGIGTVNTNIPFNMSWNVKEFLGSSLRAWKDYFPNGEIYGGDIDPSCLFIDDRIHTYQCDQMNCKQIKTLFSETLKDVKFDIIIDDGFHNITTNMCMLINSFDSLKPGGYYIIEDVISKDIDLWESLIIPFTISFKVSMYTLKIPHSINNGDNNIVIFNRL